MITKFDTSSSSVATSQGGKGMGIVTFIVISVGLYVGYRYVVKPYLEKREKNNDNE